MKALLRVVDVPEGQSGDWRVERFMVSKRDAAFTNLRASIGTSTRWIRAGTYTRLMRRGHVVMSDTPVEFRDHMEPVRVANGRVLIAGLGLGVVLQAVLDKPEVEHVQVVENSKEVIELVGSHYEMRYGRRVGIIEDDILTWRPTKNARYGMAWFDIWSDICGDNATEMRKLMARFRRRCDWAGCWCYYETLRANR